ncbi:FkbM family methyltransferase [Martelella mediterranea]|uniref:Methyltransferase FkbM-like protein n=1 Tax=Martelella mediterranea TaxID=293089 RepID=A0A4R3NKX2_9HYPH|nr:FkbM family methyltransferase [Martelella mediterranea]TCT30434.1 methyltransferase FkbM-like protein [Martelella mediterranea]
MTDTDLPKAEAFLDRFREIVSDPINLLIKRVPDAGYVDSTGRVVLHNGLTVPFRGEFSYYGEFSDILVINRGVHEPLEEYCFQELLSTLADKPETHTMIELGSYWGHYSMWFSKILPNSRCVLVEPEEVNLQAGEQNFALNGFNGEFINDFVSEAGFRIDKYLSLKGSVFNEITLLHSDIQGYELEMLAGARQALSVGRVKYIMVSTHSNALHESCLQELQSYSYMIDVSSEPARHSTSYDGFIFAHRPDLESIIGNRKILGRVAIAYSSPRELADYLESFLS